MTDTALASQSVTEASPPRAGQSPWRRAARILWRDRPAMVALAVLIAMILACLAAPLYAGHVAGTDPFRSNLGGKIKVEGKRVPIMQPSTEGLGLGVTPIGPTWSAQYLLGADAQGRDVAARLLYGGRNSLFIAGTATLICLVLAAIVGVTAGFLGGVVDMVLSRILDVLWAFPVYLLAISLSIVLLSQGITIGPIEITAGSLALPIGIIGIIYVPYVARPVRGRVLALRNSEFVLAATGLGIPRWRILLSDILPNVMPMLIVYIPLMMALNIVTESALSFLSIGVQAPDASWGTIIQDGQTLLYSRPAVSLAPGISIVITVLALNVLGDGVRDALDPRTKIRGN
ncbi:Oligopeptide transport system permease protein OppC [Hartmannibacter diazotrophicus]|uniref:Oligopeptide transport system permease protein OppC n=1 Tax=Hartmannibacter diazotrophicus TaxID=1482074 RepID=A0A2C9D2R7_9HYPH|nr:ABC transporter permease [Hartmannibacter diazotrophicus]SON53765.1 Oligopeptide transport system permease protein OppC [Hartmannibacter diazotrophicus]